MSVDYKTLQPVPFMTVQWNNFSYNISTIILWTHKVTPYPTHTCGLWSVFCVYFGRNMDCYTGSSLKKKACDVITVLKLRTICYAWGLWKLAVLQTVTFIMTARLVKFTRLQPYSVDFKAPRNPTCKTVLGKGSSILNERPVDLWNDIKAQK